MSFFFANRITGQTVLLDQEESRHCIRVLRRRQGDRLSLVDGKGLMAEGVIGKADPGQVEVQVIRVHEDYGKLPYQLHLAIAIPKSHDRFEWFLEKATEIGISRIIPLVCEHSERKSIRMSRAKKIMMAAMKQSRRAYLPQLTGITGFGDFVTGTAGHTDRFIAHCRPGNRAVLTKSRLHGTSVSIMIGPEGDFSQQEIEKATKSGFRELLLSDFVLRTETAGIAACAIVGHLLAGNREEAG